MRVAATVAEDRSIPGDASFSRKYILAVSPEKLPDGMRLLRNMQERYIRNASDTDILQSNLMATCLQARPSKSTPRSARMNPREKMRRSTDLMLSAISEKPTWYRYIRYSAVPIATSAIDFLASGVGSSSPSRYTLNGTI